MTEYEMNDIAYKACGYKNENLDYGWWTHPEVNGGRPFLIDPWSSADAAISHAERGGWYIADCYDAAIDGYHGNDRFILRLKSRSENSVRYASGAGPSVALAFRNAIVKWKEQNP